MLVFPLPGEEIPHTSGIFGAANSQFLVTAEILYLHAGSQVHDHPKNGPHRASPDSLNGDPITS